MKTGMFFLDILATAPSLTLTFLNRRKISKYFLLIRYSHWSKFFFPVEYFFEKFYDAPPVRKDKYMQLIKVFIFILILGHFMASMWIILGTSDPDGQTSWLFGNGMPVVHENKSFVWATAFYWIFTVFTTVGYGDFLYGTNAEYLFALCSMFIGVSFNSILIASLSGLFDEYGFEVLLSEKMDELMIWSRKIELCNIKSLPEFRYLDTFLYLEMQRYVRDAFLFDHNLIVEEF
jgi:hypothetical protein